MPSWRASRAIAISLSLTILAACGEGDGAAVQVVQTLSPHKGHPITFVYSHAAGEPGKPHKCNAKQDVPKILRNLEEQENVKVRYLCSNIGDELRDGDYISARAKEIEHFLFKLRAEGIPAGNIFLAGDVEGAWASLIAARRYGEHLNAVVAFAPAFYGVRERWKKLGARKAKRERAPWAQANQTAELSNGPLRAMIYTFPKATFNGPEQLAFLKHLPGVRFVVSKKCQEGYSAISGDCFADWEKQRLRNFIKKQLKNPQVAKN